MLRERLAMSVVLVVAVWLFSCDAERPSGKAVMVLFDLSESTNKSDIRDVYCDNLRRVLSSVQHGDAVITGWITQHSAAELVLPVDIRIPSFEPGTTNRLLVEARRLAADSALHVSLDSIQARVCNELRDPGRRVLQTDIMSSLTLAHSVLARHTTSEKTLVIMSDMIEDSDRYDFDTLSLSDDEAAAIIDQERSEGRIADLTGVRICVAGAFASRVERFFEVRDFWRTYFQSAGGQLVGYGGPLLNCLD